MPSRPVVVLLLLTLMLLMLVLMWVLVIKSFSTWKIYFNFHLGNRGNMYIDSTELKEDTPQVDEEKERKEKSLSCCWYTL